MEETANVILNARIREAYSQGWSQIQTYEIYDLYECQRINKAVWRDLRKRWEEAQDRQQIREVGNDQWEPPKLGVIEGSSGYLLVWLDPGFTKDPSNTILTIEQRIAGV